MPDHGLHEAVCLFVQHYVEDGPRVVRGDAQVMHQERLEVGGLQLVQLQLQEPVELVPVLVVLCPREQVGTREERVGQEEVQVVRTDAVQEGVQVGLLVCHTLQYRVEMRSEFE